MRGFYFTFFLIDKIKGSPFFLPYSCICKVSLLIFLFSPLNPLTKFQLLEVRENLREPIPTGVDKTQLWTGYLDSKSTRAVWNVLWSSVLDSEDSVSPGASSLESRDLDK